LFLFFLTRPIKRPMSDNPTGKVLITDLGKM